LTAAGAAPVFRETASGAKANQRELARAVKALDAGDTLLVTRLDRLARSTRDLLHIIDAIAKAGAGFRSLGDAWADTTTPHGRLMLTVLGGLAEFERELIRARTGEGRVRAKARGVHMGRPPKLTAHQKREALKALADGTATQADLARQFNISQSTISRLADKAAPLPLPLPLPVRPALDAATEHAARAFMQRLEGRHLAIEGLVFGSRARGDHRADSDADIAVILKGESGDRYKVAGDMAGIAFDVMMETGILVDPLPLWEDELKHPEQFSNPRLIDNIKREGLRL
jgi:DNA invertase Pin-like site-specific DNA recombinase/predicted nucleotidyltransferase